MFEKLKAYWDEGMSMLEDSFAEPDDFVTVPEGVTAEQLIEESKQYVEALLVPSHERSASPSVFLKTGKHDNVAGAEITAADDASEIKTSSDNVTRDKQESNNAADDSSDKQESNDVADGSSDPDKQEQ